MIFEQIETLVRQGLEQEIANIINEESDAAKVRVAERVSELKKGVIQKILSQIRISRLDDPGRMTVQFSFDV